MWGVFRRDVGLNAYEWQGWELITLALSLPQVAQYLHDIKQLDTAKYFEWRIASVKWL